MAIYGAKPYSLGLGDGQEGNLTIPGSGFAVPAGLEAVLEYNGLFLNVQKNVDRYKIVSIDGLNDADIRDTRDVNTDDDGETPYNSYYSGRTIAISGSIETYSISKLRDMQQALRAAFNDLTTEYPLRFRTGDFMRDHIIYCKKIGPISGVEQQANRKASRDFQISLRASNPRFLSYFQKFMDVQPDIPTLGLTQVGIATNQGNYKSQPVYRIYGPCTTATVMNGLTNKSFTINDVNSEYFEFDTANRSLFDINGTNQWNQLSDDSDYVFLNSGDNPILYSGDSPRIQISWRDSWI